MTPIICDIDNFDEKTYQECFYQSLFGENWNQKVTIARNTDGYMSGILFEHKKNVTSYGCSKALSQALIYLSRFNRDGIPVPKYTCLVSQDEKKCYFYDNAYYIDYINDITNHAQRTASAGIPNFTIGNESSLVNIVSYDNDYTELLNYIRKINDHFVTVTINQDNVVGWSRYYYNHCPTRKAKKIQFFNELRAPSAVLKLYIEPWTGNETDFKFIMDLLNDPAEQKKIGAFYTPPEYASKACELVVEAIKRVPEGNDYVIIDRCAGTGNLEWYLNDFNEQCGHDILSHVIVSSPELKEWEVLRARLGNRVRHLLPEINENETPAISENGYLVGANALDEDFLNNLVIKRYLDDDKCTVILFENPPYAQGSSVTNQKAKRGKDACDWKNGYVVKEMKKEVSGTVSNELCNAFIWSAFKYYLRQPTDSYIVFAPPKYWKYHRLVNKEMIRGFGFNRQFFHASASLISCILWSNNDDFMTENLTLEAFNVRDENSGGGVVKHSDVVVRRMNTLPSAAYYDKREFETDIRGGITTDPNGYDVNSLEKNIKVTANPITNDNIIGYMVVKGCTLDTPGLNSNLLIACRYDEHGTYLRNDDYITRLPAFAAGEYCNNIKGWTNSIYGASGDGASRYWADVQSGQLNDFLFKNLLWCCVTHYNHMVSQYGADGKLYLNQICLDENTLARNYLDNYIANGYTCTNAEQELFSCYTQLIRSCKATEEYNPNYTYGLYQIEKEIDTTYYDNRGNCQHNHGDVQNQIKVLKAKAISYYENEIAPVLMKYEFVK